MQPPETVRKKRPDKDHRTPRESGDGRPGGARKIPPSGDLSQHEARALAATAPFIASPTHQGPRNGYFFGTGEYGTGYYLDVAAAAAEADAKIEKLTEATPEAVAAAPAATQTDTVQSVSAVPAAAPTEDAAAAAKAAEAAKVALKAIEEARTFFRNLKDEITTAAQSRSHARAAIDNKVEKMVKKFNLDDEGNSLGVRKGKNTSRKMKKGAEMERWLLDRIKKGEITAAAMAKVLGTDYRGDCGSGSVPVLVAQYWSDAAGKSSFPPAPGPLKPLSWLWVGSTSQLGRCKSFGITQALASAYLREPEMTDWYGINLYEMGAFALCKATEGDKSRADVTVVPRDWMPPGGGVSRIETILRESTGRVADERAWAIDMARFEREQARERDLAAAQNCVTVVPHAPTLDPAADLEAQREAAVEASRGALPPDFLNLLPILQ